MLMNSLSIITRHSRTFCEHKLREFDIGFPEQVILMYLSEYGTVTQEDIAKYFMIDKGAIAKTSSKLEEKGFVLRSENPKNRREKLMLLSDKGKEMIAYMRKVLEEWNQCYLKGLSDDEIKEYIRITGIMAENAAKCINCEK
jgi:MarR family transcriptional regulator for hemolysin